MFYRKHAWKALLFASLLLLLATATMALAGGHLTHEALRTSDREHTYTTAEDVAAGRRAAERYWLTNHTIHEVAAAEREFSYPTAAAVAAGRQAAERYWLMNHTIHDVAAAEREFTYTTAEAVARGKVAAEAYRQASR